MNHKADEQQAELFDPIDADLDDLLAHLDEAVRGDPRAWPSTLADLVDVFTDHLHRRDKQPEAAARENAQNLILVLANYFGGRQIYLPRDEKLRLALRDNIIWLGMKSGNVEELGQRWGLTRQQVYVIAAQQKALHIKRVQPDLPLV